MFILFKINTVCPVNGNNAYSVRLTEIKAKLAGDLFNISVINVISEKKIVQIITRTLIHDICFQDQVSDALGNIHKRCAFPPDIKKWQTKLVRSFDNRFRNLFFIVNYGNSKAGDTEII